MRPTIAAIRTPDDRFARGGCAGMNGSGTGESVATAAPNGDDVAPAGPAGPPGGGGGGTAYVGSPKREPGGAAPGAVVGSSGTPQLPQYRSPGMIGASQLGHFAISLPRSH